jgi:hypothetical protein
MVCASISMLPNLIVPGAGKSGTSSLHAYLGQHPDIAMSEPKEPAIFAAGDFDRSQLANYRGMFPPSAGACAYRGESSTAYLLFPDVAARIASELPDCRFIAVLRNPVDRAISHYRWLVSLGLESRGFRAAFDSDRHEVPDPDRSKVGTYSYIFQSGCYADALHRYLERFSQEAFLLLESEELRTDPEQTMNECFDFLALDRQVNLVTLAENETRSVGNPRLRAWVDGRQAVGRSLTVPIRSTVRRMVGTERASRWKQALLGGIDSKPASVPRIDVDRDWLVDTYRSQVRELRQLAPRFDRLWTDDFPA